MELLLCVMVTTASIDDGRAAPGLAGRLRGKPISKVRILYADSKYLNHSLFDWLKANTRLALEIIRRPKGSRGFVKRPIRWTVERTFASLNRCRRLDKDREKTVLSLKGFVKLAMIRLMLNRLAPSGRDPQFNYRKAA